ncbi:hydroxymethylglutaryl-CoA synthase family protein [Pseudomonadota bacterium]
MTVGIETMNIYGGVASMDVRKIFAHRSLNLARFDNLMMEKKSVSLPCEDPVSYGVNAARPILDQLSDKEKSRIEMVITASESGIDFGKSLSTYIHHYLGLSKNCRLFEIKQACYGGTAALQLAVHYIAAGLSPGAKVLVIATDVARYAGNIVYAEPSQGAGAVAMLVSADADVFSLDPGAYGCHSYEVMDGFRPEPDMETGDSDLSLLSYMDCLKQSYDAYCGKVENVCYQNTFDYLVFHTPFAGMVKGAHQRMMRQYMKATDLDSISDFDRRISPSLSYCTKIGNVYSATLYVALSGLIDNEHTLEDRRVGLFSYGSGCSSEFFSGLISTYAKKKMAPMNIAQRLSDRHELSLDEYLNLLALNSSWTFGTKDRTVDFSEFQSVYQRAFEGRGLLVLDKIENYHRKYSWS